MWRGNLAPSPGGPAAAYPGDPAGQLPAAVAALLGHRDQEGRGPGPKPWDESADRYLEGSAPHNTRKANAADWTSWWAEIPMLSGGRGALVGYVL